MPRFHFDVMDNDTDLEGIEFPDLATMEQEAMRAAGAMVSEKTIFSETPWSMIIRDEKRTIVATITVDVRYPLRHMI